MTIQELERVIREYIMDIYNVEYIGKIKIEKLKPYGYLIKLGLNSPECPYIIYAELKDKEFLEFLRKELRDMKLTSVFYGKLEKIMPPECNVVNRACSCNDKG